MAGLHQIVAGNIITCLEPLLNCQCSFLEPLLNCQCSFQVLKEIFLGLALTVAEINIKKVQKQDLKNIKNVGMACQKICKQGRNDIIVKVNLKSLIPTSFYITVAN